MNGYVTKPVEPARPFAAIKQAMGVGEPPA
jgi:hypothetical protein